jgi:glutamine amidotransferase
MITIIDYGMGNLRSVQKALESLGTSTEISADKEKINHADKVILPGVGAFGKAMENLHKLNIVDTLKKIKVPLLGICLGMQLLMEKSEEHGQHQGLGLLEGSVDYFRNIPDIASNLVVPHMGWNKVKQTKKSSLFNNLPENFYAYFVHSYFVNPKNKNCLLGSTDYGLEFCSALESKNIYGLQFHPEKSGEIGLTILKNFINL